MRKIKIICLIVYGFILNIHLLNAQTNTIKYQITDKYGYNFESVLMNNQTESIFFTLDNRKEGNQTAISGKSDDYKFSNDKWSRIFYKNEKKSIIRFPLYGSSLIYEYPKDSLRITINNDKRKILNYNCQKATVIKGNRKFYVWFTLDIPGKFAPYGLFGTPGTVVEVLSDDIEFKISLISISKELDLLKFNTYKSFISKQKILTYKQYSNKIIKLLCDTKKENYAIMAQYGASISYEENQVYYTDRIIDIPDGLVKALQKITQ